MKKILVLNGPSYADAIEGLGEIVTRPDDFHAHPDEYGLVLFTGGADVSPGLYNDTSPDGLCSVSPLRDQEEVIVWHLARQFDIPMIGICRGIQFLNVMSGGTMIHHLDNHAGRDHATELNTGEVIMTNSFHHQMIQPPNDSIVVAWAKEPRSSVYYGEADKLIEHYGGHEMESAVFPETKCCGVQWHPEWMPKESDGYRFFHEMARRAMTMDWKDFCEYYTGGKLYGIWHAGAVSHSAG
jgi:gamma-glutamyl-gamma-aminobutyrate hydrolase PuuD